jgi:4-diphosphocytidyl-2-C-methyl-D-erythritol kinase
MAEGPRSCTLLAHAKVNLYLAVGGRRADGYHDVTTVVQALSLADGIQVRTQADSDCVRCQGLDVPAEDNLASRALAAYRGIVGDFASVEVAIEKRIPVGAGLGGGSADAAAVLRALAGEPCGTGDAPPAELLRAAAEVGADVPFFLGPGTQLLGGRGDVPVQVLPTPQLDLVLVNPGVPVPTGAAYAAFDRMLQPAPPSPSAMVAAVIDGDTAAIAGCLYNNMTEASIGLVAPIRDALRFLERSPGVLGCAMAGSGSTVFGILPTASEAAAVAEEAGSLGWWATPARSVSAGISVPQGGQG